MRKDSNGTPSRPLARLCRIPLTLLALLLAFLLGGTATAPDALPTAALKKTGGQASVSVAYEADEEDHSKTKNKSDKRDSKRGQPRRTARSAPGAPQRIGRLLPPNRRDIAPAPAHPSAGRPAAAASRPLEIPVLHCVFRC
ncbi:hypothetical protein FCH28_01775 [Streptomyces piniterrae]|uniref:Uncharacterized protein n=1 Tax=Streptomyces piniterrae TaxID=2571125 RepID=A0A4U0NWB2_9ACTN|nr:hypothetical protein [Streptomyces piniterrae]TJZ58910.1 hypothetical protein FCH28_01775 [Streptomyces piniterrae]